MDNYGNTARSTLAGAPSVADTMQAFPDLAQRVNVAQLAANAATDSLNDLRCRLGIPSDYGVKGCDGVQAEPSGDVEALAGHIENLTETVREIRGLAETLNGRL